MEKLAKEKAEIRPGLVITKKIKGNVGVGSYDIYHLWCNKAHRRPKDSLIEHLQFMFH